MCVWERIFGQNHASIITHLVFFPAEHGKFCTRQSPRTHKHKCSPILKPSPAGDVIREVLHWIDSGLYSKVSLSSKMMFIYQKASLLGFYSPDTLLQTVSLFPMLPLSPFYSISSDCLLVINSMTSTAIFHLSTPADQRYWKFGFNDTLSHLPSFSSKLCY